ncbi:MAG: LysR family transcriptional regulator [Chthoniobacterales bacterium]
MNTHHLELFYYIARYEGIVSACRNMPYGVQQPAVSAQVLKLEEYLGVKLFERKPFRLTTAGERLYGYIAPFFTGMPHLEAEIRGQLSQEIRLAGPTLMMRDHLPELLQDLRIQFPRLKVTLQEAGQRIAEQLVQRGDANFAVSVMEETLTSGLQFSALIELPLVLLVPAATSFQKDLDILRDGNAGKLDLITLPSKELLHRLFQRTLEKRKQNWPVAMEVSSIDLIVEYVSHGLGVGLSILSPRTPIPKSVRILPLKDFPSLPIGAFWKGKLSPVSEALLNALRERAKLITEETSTFSEKIKILKRAVGDGKSQGDRHVKTC